MSPLITQTGYATAVLDFTNDFSFFLASLVALTAFSAGMIALEAIRYHFSQKAKLDTAAPTEVPEYRKAA
jgi:hypothetical protein